MTSTLIVGNGIGMALDAQYFCLQAGLQESWDSFDVDKKKLISLGSDNMPCTETELEENHKIMTSCQKILEFQDLQLLNSKGEAYPNIYRDFIYKTAFHFFNYNGALPEKFVDNLIELIKSGCHLVTLNYDKLLYSPLIERNILCGYSGYLVDGVCNSGYRYENMLRTFSTFNWYLHLHGSPIFYTHDSEIKKCKIYETPIAAENNHKLHEHIVLAKTDLKPEIISNSPILGSYLDFFSKALFESNKLYLFGYSGEDTHINNEIRNWSIEKSRKCDKLTIYIIEWNGSDRSCQSWKNLLIPDMPPENRDKIQVHFEKMNNILEYKFQNSA
ncbi:SIR2 family protein [Legionella sp. 16cNR16C]|uniref:SIR2 family protein n=1 Tax=Legionella sp. 16cNR16C TaxID=2905656 RepID=UPI001E62DE76|nr:SIR2 family protein [Legionella sp. 16cNR16C]MCE3043374.1 SIR2 family protein [Legionella sp. 16cNR16C]